MFNLYMIAVLVVMITRYVSENICIAGSVNAGLRNLKRFALAYAGGDWYSKRGLVFSIADFGFGLSPIKIRRLFFRALLEGATCKAN